MSLLLTSFSLFLSSLYYWRNYSSIFFFFCGVYKYILCSALNSFIYWRFKYLWNMKILSVDMGFFFTCKTVIVNRSEGFIYCLLWRNLLWMFHLIWKLEGAYPFSLTHCSWTCLTHPKFKICFPSRKLYRFSVLFVEHVLLVHA